MKHLDLAVFVKDLDKLFNDMQDKAVDGSALVITAARVIENQAKEIEALKVKLKQYHLKEDLDRNLNLIYGKEFIK